MNLIERAKNIMLSPKTEWDAIAADPTPTATLVTAYVLPLAALSAIAHFISAALIGTTVPFGGTFRMPMGWALGMLVYQLVMSVVAVFVLGFIIDALATTFGGQKNFNQAVKVAAYSYTAGWLGGVLGIVPWVGWLLGLLVALYGIYLLYLGLPKLMNNPPEKSVAYTVVVIVVAIVVAVVIAVIGTMITAPVMMAGMGGMHGSTGGTVTYDKDSKMGKLQEFGKKMEEAGKKMEEAQKSGDSKKQMEAAMATLGTALSGGKGVEPVQLDVLKPLLPDNVAGLPRTASNADRSGVAGLMAAKVGGEYGDNSGKKLSLEIVDTGGAAGLTALAGWAAIGAGSERENDARIERMRKEGNRMVHEEISKTGGANTYTVILADRFIVSGRGNGVDIDAVKKAVNGLDLGKIEALK